jgi:hypothetical protein
VKVNANIIRAILGFWRRRVVAHSSGGSYFAPFAVNQDFTELTFCGRLMPFSKEEVIWHRALQSKSHGTLPQCPSYGAFC